MNHGTPCLAYACIEKNVLRIDKKKLAKLKLPNSPKLQELKKGKDIVIDGRKIKSKEITYSQKGRKVAIVLDTAENSEILKIAKDAELFICESTYLDEEELAKEYKHLDVSQTAKIAKKAKVKKLVLVHLSQKNSLRGKEFIKEAKKHFSNVVLGEDLDRFEIWGLIETF